jgi:hypothetical protein
MTRQKKTKESRRTNPADFSVTAYPDENGKHIQQKTGHTLEDSSFQIPTQQPSKRNTSP